MANKSHIRKSCIKEHQSQNRYSLYGVSSKYVSGKNTTKTVINGLEKNTDYYFRVRTYNKVNNKMYYSPWSEARNNSTL